METNTSKIKPKENPAILDIILKYKLYQEISIKPQFYWKHSFPPYGIPIPGVYEEPIISAKISKEDFNKLQMGDYCSSLNINGIELPFRCYVWSLGWYFEMKYDNPREIFDITLHFANK